MSEVDERKPTGVARLLGLEGVVDNGAQSGRAVLHFRATMDMCHSGGIVQGGFVTGWLDMAMANVVLSKSNYEQNLLSLEIKVSFLASAGPGLIVAEAWIERMGRSTGFLEARLLNEAGTVLAKASSTVKLVPMKR
ncbi:MAG TPA: PaaI family thioesterase [Rhizomicrobium sp.]|nr:PaaI family thioesterase [Rhizomicrobium sp.]